jgi:hypothetical protein
MTLEQAIKTYLLTKTALTNLVSTRIYYSTLPQTPTYPAISFFKVSNIRQHDLDVGSGYYQFDVWTLTYIQGVEIANEIRLALQREKRNISGIEMIQGVYLNEIDLYEPDTKLHHIALDMKILYRGD